MKGRSSWPKWKKAETEDVQEEIVYLVDIKRKNFNQVATILKKSPQSIGSLYCWAKLEGA